MAFFSADNASAIFKRSVSDNSSRITLSGLMLKVLMELDGEKNLDAIHQALTIDIGELENIIERLESLQLIERVNLSPPPLQTEFFDFLKNHLTRAMGPIAELIIEEELQNCNERPGNMSLQSAAELVELLARQILRPEKRLEFQQTMVSRIKELSS